MNLTECTHTIKMTKIKNVNYRNMLDKHIIKLVTEQDIFRAFENVDMKRQAEHKAFLALYFGTGARPAELLALKGKNFIKDGAFIKVELLQTLKRGAPRIIWLPIKRPLNQYIAKYVFGIMPEMYVFYSLRGRSVQKRTYVNKKTGAVRETIYIDTSYKLKNWFKRWFNGVIDGGITSYYLRHNRFSKMAMDGFTDMDIMNMKGGKTMESVRPYVHYSKDKGKKLSKATY